MMIELPYGLWTCADGREVLFNRRYRPIWQCRPGEEPTPADPDEKVPFEIEKHYWPRDPDAPWRSKATRARCELVLTVWGLPTDLFELSRLRFEEPPCRR